MPFFLTQASYTSDSWGPSFRTVPELGAGETVSRILSNTIENTQVVLDEQWIDIRDIENVHRSQFLRLECG
jgi:hypothetical protein